jgi:hypothetical protein
MLAGCEGGCAADRRVAMQIEKRFDGWRIVRGWALPPLRAADDETVMPAELGAGLH